MTGAPVEPDAAMPVSVPDEAAAGEPEKAAGDAIMLDVLAAVAGLAAPNSPAHGALPPLSSTALLRR